MRNLKFRTILIILMVFLTSGLSAQTEGQTTEKEIKVIKTGTVDDNGGHEEGQRSLVHYCNQIIGELNLETDVLSLNFNETYSFAQIYIYKDGICIFDRSQSVIEGGIVTFNLSAFGSGDYMIEVLTDELYMYGSFEIE